MFPTMINSNNRLVVHDHFNRLHRQGRLAALWAKLSGGSASLKEFTFQAFRLQGGRKYLGLKLIPLDRIIGSVSRSRDFDRRFRPLRMDLRDRWTEIYLRSEKGSWPPVSVYKVGEAYFIEDGHHRVSVANYLGMSCIHAEVWEFAMQPGREELIPLEVPCPCRSPQILPSPLQG